MRTTTWIIPAGLVLTPQMIRFARLPSTDPQFDANRWRDLRSRQYMCRDLQTHLHLERRTLYDIYEMLGPPAGFEGNNATDFANWAGQPDVSRLLYEMPDNR